MIARLIAPIGSRRMPHRHRIRSPRAREDHPPRGRLRGARPLPRPSEVAGGAHRPLRGARDSGVSRVWRAAPRSHRVCFGAFVHDRLDVFSCKGRGFCRSCGGRRAADLAAHLVDRVLPRSRSDTESDRTHRRVYGRVSGVRPSGTETSRRRPVHGNHLPHRGPDSLASIADSDEKSPAILPEFSHSMQTRDPSLRDCAHDPTPRAVVFTRPSRVSVLIPPCSCFLV